jgi:hypothetical protein
VANPEYQVQVGNLELRADLAILAILVGAVFQA